MSTEINMILVNDHRICQCDCDCTAKVFKTIIISGETLAVCTECFDGLDAEKDVTCIECYEIRIDEDGELDARVEAGMKCGVCAYG